MDYRLILTLISAILMGVPAVYVLHCLLLEPKDSHFGPMRSKDKVVIFVQEQHEQPVVLWDRIRFFFGVYTVMGTQWIIEDSRQQVERFTCPFCLSFWTSFPFTFFLILSVYNLTLDAVLWFFPAHFTIAITSYAIHRLLWRS